jgi:transposase
MFRFDGKVRVWLHRDAVDFRMSINGLSALVKQSMQLDPLGDDIFAFCNRRRDRIKLLLWERTGFWLLMKRLEQDRFAWPRKEPVMALTSEQLHWLLEGIDLEAMRRHPARHYQHAC